MWAAYGVFQICAMTMKQRQHGNDGISLDNKAEDARLSRNLSEDLLV